jgi:hypothetical protein
MIHLQGDLSINILRMPFKATSMCVERFLTCPKKRFLTG